MIKVFPLPITLACLLASVPLSATELPAPSTTMATTAVETRHDAGVEELLLRALSLIGAKYKAGGNHEDQGFDCSGFVRFVFADVLSLQLPHSAYAMSRLGIEVARDALQPGDLLFFNTRNRRFSHVAIYMGEGRFVHAPSRGKSVEIVDLQDGYWKRRFNGARRLAIPD